MEMWKKYLLPENIDQALDVLASAQGHTTVVAGGTDLLLDIQQGRHEPADVMLDVSKISEMRKINIDDGKVFLGAAMTHTEIIHNDIIKFHAQCVVEGCGLIGGPQVRNVATIGGNVAHALPAGDGTISLLALGSEAQLASQSGRRWLPLEDLFAGPGKTTFDRGKEIVVGFRFPIRKKGEASTFYRVMRPQGVAIAIMNMSAWMRCSSDGTIEDIRIAMGPAGPRPFRARKTEEFLIGKHYDLVALEGASREMSSEAQLRTSPHRATAEYRHSLIPVLLKRVLEVAYQRSLDA